MVLAGSTSAGSLMWSARAAPGRASTTATRSRRVRIERPSTDFSTDSSEELGEIVSSERDIAACEEHGQYTPRQPRREVNRGPSSLLHVSGSGLLFQSRVLDHS